jgi:preflagellin peptidase FlaK
VLASTPDLLRLVAVPVLGWAAWRDVKTRRVPNRTWKPLAVLAVVLLLWEGAGAWATGDRLFFLQVAISVGFIVPLSTAFWYMGSFGGADAKAFYVVAVLFPVYPVFYLPWAALPLEPTPVGVFSLTILSNTVVVGAAYPVAVALGNLVRGHVGWPMLIGKPVSWDRATDEYGMLLETPDGFTRGGLDLDALRMYLQWRGESLAALRADPDALRNPSTLPAEPNAPGDGGLATDGGVSADGTDAAAPATDAAEPGAATTTPDDDPWGAAAFLDDIEGSAYGTSPDQLREGLEVLTTADEVWISPGIPFIVPMFFGLLLSLVYGDVLFTAVAALGFA